MFDNLINLEYQDSDLTKIVKDSFGKNIGPQKLTKGDQKTQKKLGKLFVEKNRSRKGWESKIQDKIWEVNRESDNTVTVGERTLHKKDVAEVRYW